MRRIIILVFCGLYSICLHAQNRSINFRHEEWKKVLKQAKEEKKLVFVDCYTSWCEPCKIMAKEVFTQDSVADFFNQHFVNAKFDMEKEGAPLRKKFAVRFYPTLLFIDPRTEEMVHTLGGAGEADWLISGGRMALDPPNNLRGLGLRYEAGERTSELMGRYLRALAGAGMEMRQDSVMNAYFETFTDEQFVTPENWEIISANMNSYTNPFSYLYQRVMMLYPRFCEVVDGKKVEMILNYAMRNYMSRYVRWEATRGNFDKEGHVKLLEYMRTFDYSQVPIWLAQMYTAGYMGNEDYRGMLTSMKEATKFHFMNSSEQYYYLMLYLSEFAHSGDRPLIKEVLDWIVELEKIYPSDYLVTLNKSKLLMGYGEVEAAEKAKIEAEAFLNARR